MDWFIYSISISAGEGKINIQWQDISACANCEIMVGFIQMVKNESISFRESEE